LQALRTLVEREGSDLHLKAHAPPLFRVHGQLGPDSDAQSLDPQDTEGALRALLQDPNKYEEFANEHEVDFSFELEGAARFRINAFRQRGHISLACRAIPHSISTIDD